MASDLSLFLFVVSESLNESTAVIITSTIDRNAVAAFVMYA